MIPYKQKEFDERGSCFSVCLASVLELSPNLVPNLVQDAIQDLGEFASLMSFF